MKERNEVRKKERESWKILVENCEKIQLKENFSFCV